MLKDVSSNKVSRDTEVNRLNKAPDYFLPVALRQAWM